MGDRRSKEDYVHQILTSIYVTNFPEQFSFRDLWKKCQEYGRVIDVYIPNRRTKSGAVKNDGEHKQVAEMDYKPSLVIDESCMLEYDYSLAPKGKVADFGLLTNLKTELLEKFKSHVGVGSWFSSLDKRICIKTKMEQNIFETFKIIIKGKVFWIRAKEVSGWIPDFLDEDEEDEEEDESDEDLLDNDPIHEEPKHYNKSNFEEGEIQSEDPFHIYNLLVKKPKNDNKEDESSKATLKYPPGFTPDDVLRTKDVQDVDDVVEVQENIQKSNKQDNFTKDNNFRGVTHSKEEDKESFCSGEFRRSVGPQIGGILCAWDPRMFHKHNATISDYFVAIQGEWIANAKKYLVISVYAPQEASEKRMLWSYLNHMIDRWDEWSGKVPLGGCAFTWCHKSGSKMSKLDRFFISEGIMGFCPNITSINLDRYLSDHRPIILRELEATEIAQKAKIKWSIEGDENSKKFHGILNKKRNQHAIRGILSEGNWIEDPNSVKNELFSYFKERFDSPCSSRLMLDREFLNKLSADQSIDLDSNVTIEEIKKAVWDCGIDKSSGPDGFTFGFYRRYWVIIKKDVADAVSLFFIS
nr:RNA-directed DNA polymerase, eukaryota [Tanacetum cinerariifolium]